MTNSTASATNFVTTVEVVNTLNALATACLSQANLINAEIEGHCHDLQQAMAKGQRIACLMHERLIKELTIEQELALQKAEWLIEQANKRINPAQ